MGKKIYVGAGGWGHLEPGQEPPEECKFYVEMDPATEKADNFFAETAAEIKETAATGNLHPMEKRGIPSLVKDCELIQAYLEDGMVQEQAPFIKQIIARLLELAYAVGVSYGSMQKADLNENENFRRDTSDALAAIFADQQKILAAINRRNHDETGQFCFVRTFVEALFVAHKKPGDETMPAEISRTDAKGAFHREAEATVCYNIRARLRQRGIDFRGKEKRRYYTFDEIAGACRELGYDFRDDAILLYLKKEGCIFNEGQMREIERK